MGFIPIPITIMLIRVIAQSIDFSRNNVYIFVFGEFFKINIEFLAKDYR